jgi:hypothetical protein
MATRKISSSSCHSGNAIDSLSYRVHDRVLRRRVVVQHDVSAAVSLDVVALYAREKFAKPPARAHRTYIQEPENPCRWLNLP